MISVSTKIKYTNQKIPVKINNQQSTGIELILSKFIYFNLFVLVTLILLGLIAGLILLEQGYQLENNRILFRFVELFNLNLEANVPAWYSAFLMIVISGLSLFISKVNTLPEKKYFLGMSVLFLMMSVDEISSIHEIMNNPVRNALSLSGAFYWAWIVPGLIFLFMMIFVFRQFFMMINRRFRRLFILSGFIYIMGAVGFEMLGGWLYSNKLGDSYFYIFEVVVEESLEMFGLLLFIYALIEYIKSFGEDIHITIR